MAFLRILFFFLIIVFLFRLIARPLMRYAFKQMEKKMSSGINKEPERPEGDVRIEDARSNDQDFTDYEEIK